jgi:transposase-like protein
MNRAGSTTRPGRRRRARVVRLYRKGYDVPEIARRLGLQRKAVNLHLAGAGVPRVLDAERTPRFWPDRRAPYWELRRRNGGASEVVLGRKFCPGCGRWRHVVDFPLVGGVLYRCETCSRVAKRIGYRRLSPEARALRLEYMRIYHEGHRRGEPRPRKSSVVDRPERVLLPRAPLVVELDRLNGNLRSVCARAGVPERTVFRLRHDGGRWVRIDTADKLAVAMGIPLALIYRADR